MAKPRVFVSSTYYDLKHIRADLERFIQEQGYEPVLNEKGHIAYGNTEKLEEYCYKEIKHCDILISIIGGRYGKSSDEEHSISNKELLEATKLGKQVYVFIESSVAGEFKIYQANKEIEGINYQAADNIKIYHFIDEVNKMPKNNTVHIFSGASDITTYLKEQWAGLFQRLLNDESKKKEIDVIQKLTEASNTLKQMVDFLVAENKDSHEAITQILSTKHPIFNEIQRKANIPFRIYFETLGELATLFESRNYKSIEKGYGGYEGHEGYESWLLNDLNTIISISQEVFELEYDKSESNFALTSSKLKLMTSSNWTSDMVLKDILNDQK